MADETGSTDTSETTSEVNPLQSELEAAKAELKRAQLESEQQKFVNQKQRNENDGFRRQVEQYRSNLEAQGYEEPKATAESRMQEQLARQREEMGLMRYKLENPNWQDTWGDVQKIVQDPVAVEEVAVFDREGQPDMFKSLSNAQTRVELSQLRELKAATEEAKKTKSSEQERLKGQGHISGTPASAAEETVDVDGMTSDEMIRAGLVESDPRDPVRERHPKEG